MKENQYRLEGLSCPSCAMKIEDRIRKNGDYRDVSLNFATQTLTLSSGQVDMIQLLQKEVDAIEDGVVVKLIGQEPLSQRSPEVNKTIWYRLGIGGLLFLIGLIGQFDVLTEVLLFGTAYVVVGGDVVLRAIRNILKGQVFDENFLMSIATIGAFAIGEYAEGVTVMLFYQIGELFQDMAVHRSRASIASLMDIRPDMAWVKEGEQLHQVKAELVTIDQHIFVKAGERIPLDGIVVSGQSLLDTSALTGESVPRSVGVEDHVLSGTVNQSSLLEIQVKKLFGESTVARILELVENATNKKAETEKFITKFARYYTPVVVYMALALAIIPPIFIEGASFSEWVHRALIFLVISCPCALVISIPLGFFGGIGGASKHGVLIKGSNYLEALNNVKTVVFDKTGTLTKGVFRVTHIEPVHGTSDVVLQTAALIESQSNHPIAKSIIKSYGKPLTSEGLVVEEVLGKGLVANFEGEVLLAGNETLFKDYGISINTVAQLGTIVHVGKGGIYLGYLVISDEVKEDSKRTIQALRDLGVKRIVMLTGDREQVGTAIGTLLGIDEVYSELLPHEKVEKLETLLDATGKEKTIFVGDGINDAPVLARADVGVAMGGVGSDAAIEAADVVLMTDEPSKLVDAIRVAKRTRSIVWQNIIFAMGVKGIVLILGAGGLATMWEAVFADVGVALLAILNAMRIIRKPLK